MGRPAGAGRRRASGGGDGPGVVEDGPSGTAGARMPQEDTGPRARLPQARARRSPAAGGRGPAADPRPAAAAGSPGPSASGAAPPARRALHGRTCCPFVPPVPPRRPLPPVALLLLLLAAAACAGRRPVPAGNVEPGWSQEGTASWYGPRFHGRPTASGETFDMEAMTAAHPSLPLGTRIRVTVLETGRRTVLRVNDRGPFVDDRILDVSRAAARRLGFLEEGTARVRVEVVGSPPDCWEVQVGSYAEAGNAREVLRRLRREDEPARLEDGPRGFTRVVAGPYGDRAEALRLRGAWGGVLRACAEERDDGEGEG